MPIIKPHSIKEILKYYQTIINNPENIHDNNHTLVKGELDQHSEEVKKIICQRKGLYYELKYHLDCIGGFDKDGLIKSSVNEYVSYIDELFEINKTNFIKYRDYHVFYINKRTRMSSSGKLDKNGQVPTEFNGLDNGIIDEKIQALYYTVFNQKQENFRQWADKNLR